MGRILSHAQRARRFGDPAGHCQGSDKCKADATHWVLAEGAERGSTDVADFLAACGWHAKELGDKRDKEFRRMSNKGSEKAAGTSRFRAGMKRQIQALVDNGDMSAAELIALRQEIEDAIAAKVYLMRAGGMSLAEIGAEVGMTRAAVRNKYFLRAGIETPESARKPGGQPSELR